MLDSFKDPVGVNRPNVCDDSHIYYSKFERNVLLPACAVSRHKHVLVHKTANSLNPLANNFVPHNNTFNLGLDAWSSCACATDYFYSSDLSSFGRDTNTPGHHTESQLSHTFSNDDKHVHISNATVPSILHVPWSILNPYAAEFISSANSYIENGMVASLIITVLIISVLLINEIINMNSDQVSNTTSPRYTLKQLRLANANKIIVGHLNNSIRNKLEYLKYLMMENVDILLISETKLNDTFPVSQFMVGGFHTPYREDRNDDGGGLLLYVRDHIPCKRVILEFCPQIEVTVTEINLRKKKWILICSYNPHKTMIDSHLDSISTQLYELCKKYENIILIGDYNSEMYEDAMSGFCSTYNLKNLVNNPTCFKNIDNPSCIDLILTNKPRCFQNTSVIETSISDFHKLTVTVIMMNFQNQIPKTLNYRNYKRFNNENFRNDLLQELAKRDHQNRMH